MLRAVIWDFDGTLVDTRARNYAVACRIVEEAAGRPAATFPALASEEAYEAAWRRVRNWRELYTDAFGFPETLVDELGARWTPYHREDATPVRPFPGIADALTALAGVPHGIVSQNSRENIARLLAEWDLDGHFAHVVGHTDVPRDRQKPAPDGLLACLATLHDGDDGTALYVGDHEADAECARNAAAVLARQGARMRVLAVAARFGGIDRPHRWRPRPDFIAATPADVVALAQTLTAP